MSEHDGPQETTEALVYGGPFDGDYITVKIPRPWRGTSVPLLHVGSQIVHWYLLLNMDRHGPMTLTHMKAEPYDLEGKHRATTEEET